MKFIHKRYFTRKTKYLPDVETEMESRTNLDVIERHIVTQAEDTSKKQHSVVREPSYAPMEKLLSGLPNVYI